MIKVAITDESRRMEIIISPDSFEKMGDGSITGALIKIYGPERIAGNEDITLIFVERSLEEVQAKGLQEVIIPSYMPKSLVEDVLYLILNGHKIDTCTISEKEAEKEDPKKFL